MKKILITGANGFIGNSLYKTLLKAGRSCVGTVRSINLNSSNSNNKYIEVGNIGSNTNWKEILNDVDCIIHCAGKAHIMETKKDDKQSIYHSANVDGTKQLAKQAAEAKVKRLIFLSSIKVNGEYTTNNNDTGEDCSLKKIFMHSDKPNPDDAYAISKFKAEKELWKISSRTGLEVVVVRLPLVYGCGAKGNVARLVKSLRSRIPLPLGLVKNQRSMIGIDNLVDLLLQCVDHQEASGKTFLVSDGKDLSTPEFIRLIASSMGRKPNLFNFPISLLKFLSSILGRREEINRLTGSLRIDNSYTKETLNWTPPISVEEGISRMVQENDKNF